MSVGKGLFVKSTVTYTYKSADLALVGKPLEIRLGTLGLVVDNEVEFDDVKLTRSEGTLTPPTTLKLNGITAAGGNVTITWAGAAGVKLQSSATLGGVWADVTGSDGGSTVTVPAGNPPAFFRLVK